MKISNTQLIAFGLLGFVFYKMTQKPAPVYVPPPAPTLPPQTSANASKRQKFLKWVALMISIFGIAKSMWQPGGIFYNTGVPEPDASGVFPPGFANELANVA